MKLTADENQILEFIRERGPVTRRQIVLCLEPVDGKAKISGAYLTQEILFHLNALESAEEITCQLNISGRHIRLAKS